MACSPTLQKKSDQKEQPVRIANDSLEYEIIIIDPGFTAYLQSIYSLLHDLKIFIRNPI